MDIEKAKIIGDGVEAEITEAFYASSAKRKSKTKKGTVLIANILSGKLAEGETIKIENVGGGKANLYDTISRIEIDKKQVNFASSGSSVGICLRSLSLKDVQP